MEDQSVRERRSIVSASVPESMRARLEQRAQDNYRSVSGEIRLALDEHLQREQPAASEAER